VTETRTINQESDGFRKTSAFFWTMLALCILDLILLFWIFNPLRHAPRERFQHSELGHTVARIKPVTPDELAKPSPLGKVAGSRAATHNHVSFAADASRRPRLVAAANHPAAAIE
jgi:hypothetical protein